MRSASAIVASGSRSSSLLAATTVLGLWAGSARAATAPAMLADGDPQVRLAEVDGSGTGIALKVRLRIPNEASPDGKKPSPGIISFKSEGKESKALSVEDVPFQPRAFILVLRVSRELGKEYFAEVKKAVEGFSDGLQADDTIGLVMYDSGAHTVAMLVKRDEFKKVVGKITAGDAGANLKAGLESAHVLWENLAKGREATVVVLAGAQSHEGKVLPAPSLAKFEGANVKVLGVGSRENDTAMRQCLEDVAGKLGGQFLFAEKGEVGAKLAEAVRPAYRVYLVGTRLDGMKADGEQHTVQAAVTSPAGLLTANLAYKAPFKSRPPWLLYGVLGVVGLVVVLLGVRMVSSSHNVDDNWVRARKGADSPPATPPNPPSTSVAPSVPPGDAVSVRKWGRLLLPNGTCHELQGVRVYIGAVPRISDVVNDIVFLNETVSAKHATIACTDSGIHLTDLSSSNGTFVNERRVTDAMIHDGDRLAFGDVKVIFLTESAAAKPS